MSYATRGGGPASSTNVLQDSGQYYGDKERRLLKSQAGKARGKGKVTDKAQTRGPDFRTKPVANDLLKELLATPGGIKQMSDAAQYGKLVEMRQKQAMIDRSDQAMREFQRLTQSMTDRDRESMRTARGGQPVPNVSPVVQRAVQNAMERQKRTLEESAALLQGRPVQRDRAGRPVAVGGTGNVNATPLLGETGGGVNFGQAYGMGRNAGRAGR